MSKPIININRSSWHKTNGLRITVKTEHDGFCTGQMYSVEDARYLAKELNKACDEIEAEGSMCKKQFINLGKNQVLLIANKKTEDL